MTKLLEKALQAVRRLPADSQDEIACSILALILTSKPRSAASSEEAQVRGTRDPRSD